MPIPLFSEYMLGKSHSTLLYPPTAPPEIGISHRVGVASRLSPKFTVVPWCVCQGAGSASGVAGRDQIYLGWWG